MAIRYVYAAIYLAAGVLAWDARTNRHMHVIAASLGACQGDNQDLDCLAQQAVSVITLAFCLFFVGMCHSTWSMRQYNWQGRHSWHCGWWPAKMLALAGFLPLSSVLPSSIITHFYGGFAHAGAGLFFIIPLICVIRYITRLNHRWCYTNFDDSYRKVIVVSVIAHVGSSTWTIVMVFWYTGCWQNIVVLVTTIILLAIMYKISLKLKSKAPGFFMEPGLVAVYMVFLRWLAITSEPETGCYKKDKAGAISMTALAFGAGLISATVSAFSTGTQYTSIQFGSGGVGPEPPYGYEFFHFVFATGCMYFGMLFLGWETQLQHTTAEIRWMSGWMSTGVYIVIECAVAISFVAIQLARIYGIGWLEQKLSRIFGTAGQLLQQGQGQVLQLPQQHEGIDQLPAAGQQQAPSARPPVSQTMDDPPPASPPRSSATTEEYLSD